MPRRRIIFSENEYYHVYNRSVGSEKIFNNKSNCLRAMELINYYRFNVDVSYSHIRRLQSDIRDKKLSSIYSSAPLVYIISFVLMPDHFHFLLFQFKENGILRFISQFQNSFAKYFNTKYNRYGSLFSNRFKGVRIESESQLFHTVRYIELNPVTSYLISFDKLSSWSFSSYFFYTNPDSRSFFNFVNKEIVLQRFRSVKNFTDFLKNQVDYQRSLRKIKGLLLDDKKTPGFLHCQRRVLKC